jgi:hypothetical protein
LQFDRLCAASYGDIHHDRAAAGKPIAVEDSMIAATVRAYGAHAIATQSGGCRAVDRRPSLPHPDSRSLSVEFGNNHRRGHGMPNVVGMKDALGKNDRSMLYLLIGKLS